MKKVSGIQYTKRQVKIYSSLVAQFIVFVCIVACKHVSKKDAGTRVPASLNNSHNFVYEETVHEAEKQLIDGDYLEALNLYSAAFESDSSRTKGTDLFNALVASAKIDEYRLSAKLLRALVQRGFTLVELQNYHELQGFLSSQVYKNFKDSEYANLKNSADSTMDKGFYTVVDSLRVIDQKKYCINDGVQYELTDSLTLKFVQLLENYDGMIPSESKIGIPKNENSQLTITPRYDVLIIHSFQAGENELIPFLQKSLRKGTLSPELYSFYMGFYNPDYSDHCYVSSINCNWYKKDLSEINVETINNNRRSIGLYTLNELVERALYYHGQSKRPSFKMFVPICKFNNEEMKMIYIPLNLVNENC